MPLVCTLQPASEIPIFRQIVRQVQQAVVRGQLEVGEQLPPVRTLAESLVVNPNTVAKAYKELIALGVLESQTGRGVFVAAKRQIFSSAERRRRLKAAAAHFCHEALLFDYNLEQLHTLLDKSWRELPRQPKPPSNKETRP